LLPTHGGKVTIPRFQFKLTAGGGGSLGLGGGSEEALLHRIHPPRVQWCDIVETAEMQQAVDDVELEFRDTRVVPNSAEFSCAVSTLTKISPC
jgi:hypothetical protein